MTRSPQASSPSPDPPPDGAPPAADTEILEDKAALEGELRETYAGGEAPPGDGASPEGEGARVKISFDFSPAMCRKILDKGSKFIARRVGKKWEADPEELDMIAPALSDVMNEYVAPWLPDFLGRHEKLLALGGVLAFYALPRLLDEFDEQEGARASGSPAPAAA